MAASYKDRTRANLLYILSKHIGERNGIHMDELVLHATAEPWTRRRNAALQRQLRQQIVELRNEGYHICGHPRSGYYMAATPAELDQTCLFLYDRAMTSLQQVAAMKRISLPDLRGQLRLPT